MSPSFDPEAQVVAEAVDADRQLRRRRPEPLVGVPDVRPDERHAAAAANSRTALEVEVLRNSWSGRTTPRGMRRSDRDQGGRRSGSSVMVGSTPTRLPGSPPRILPAPVAAGRPGDRRHGAPARGLRSMTMRTRTRAVVGVCCLAISVAACTARAPVTTSGPLEPRRRRRRPPARPPARAGRSSSPPSNRVRATLDRSVSRAGVSITSSSWSRRTGRSTTSSGGSRAPKGLPRASGATARRSRSRGRPTTRRAHSTTSWAVSSRSTAVG